MSTYRKIEDARELVEKLEGDYLKRWGWKYTCHTPASVWLWEKTTDYGRTLLVERHTAIYMTERAFDTDIESAPLPPSDES